MWRVLFAFAIISDGVSAQPTYPIYGPHAQAVYQQQGIAASASPQRQIRRAKKAKEGTGNPSFMPPDGEDYTYIYYPVTTDGYKVTGTIQATVAKGYTLGAMVQSAVVEGAIYPIPIYQFDANGNYKYLNDWSNEQSFYFDIPVGRSRYYFMKIVYRHGYNTINTWQTVNRFPSGIFDNLYYLPGRFINEIRDKAVDQGGLISTDYILVADNELPRAFSKAAAHTQFRRNSDWWPDNGNSRLETVELYDAVGGSFSQMSLPFELYFANYVKDQDRLNSPIPTMGAFDFQQAILPETVSITSWNTTRFTKTEWMERIVPASWMNDPVGYASYCQENESLYAVVWPTFSADQLRVSLDGGRFFVNVKMNLSNF